MYIKPQTHPTSSIYMMKTVSEMPMPSAISYFWNMGSLLGMSLSIQLISGLFLAMHYSCDIKLAFLSVDHIMRDVTLGWFLRITHANTASLFFILLYLHISRGIYFKSFFILRTWLSGASILILIMGIAFLGYVLVWGQMSFWGATVITSLASAVPMIGDLVVVWLWGGFSVDNATLTRFFTLHFLLPFIAVAAVLVHLYFLHAEGSSNPLGVNSVLDKVPFSPFFVSKDLLGALLTILVLFTLVFWNPWLLGDPENFISANPLVTPAHIQPEWYFLFVYAILRSIPNKLGGVIGLAMSIIVLFLAPFTSGSVIKSSSFSPSNKLKFWGLVVTVILLTWIGACPVEAPFILAGQVLTVLYFTLFFLTI